MVLDVGRLGLWTGEFDQLPVSELLLAVQQVEDAGFGALWLGELFGREALTQAAIVLGATGRIVVGTGVASVHGRDGTVTMQAQRTLREAYGDRFVLGLGIGHPWTTGQRGLPFPPRLPAMRAFLDRMDATAFGPPGAQPRPPRVLGAVGAGMLALAAERADGALPFGMPVKHTRHAREILGPDTFLGVVLPVLPTADPGRAATFVAESLPNRAETLRALGYDLSADLTGELIAWGDGIPRRVREHLDAGADHVSLNVIGSFQPGALAGMVEACAGISGS